jgi:hypothetical protein
MFLLRVVILDLVHFYLPPLMWNTCLSHFSEDAIVWRARSSSLYSLPLNLFASRFQRNRARSALPVINSFLKNISLWAIRHYNLRSFIRVNINKREFTNKNFKLEITKIGSWNFSKVVETTGYRAISICRLGIPHAPKGFFQEPHEFYFSLNSSYRLKKREDLLRKRIASWSHFLGKVIG